MPVSYKKAIAALADCRKLDDAKTFTDSAEALAVWARIYKDNEAGRQARQLRLHAHRRMGHLARDLAKRKGRSGGGSEPGPVALLRKHGLTRHQADAANHLAKMDGDDFETFVNQDVPPAPTSIVRRYRRLKTLTTWVLLRERPRTPFACAAYIQKTDPKGLAKSLTDDERDVARNMVDNLIKWLQDFNRALSKT